MTDCLIALLLSLTALAPDHSGVIAGLVVNGSTGRSPVPHAPIVLRVADGGSLIPVTETTSDEEGRFRFEGLPILEQVEYLPGANHEGIHYPGARVRLTGPTASDLTIVVYDTLAEPSPLVAARHEMRLRTEGDAVFVEETILVANRSRRTYVGPPSATDEPEVTLRLSLPPDFAKVTFDKEFFGRQFQLRDRILETRIPWTPGQRELKFSYWASREKLRGHLRRTLDIPTEQLLVVADRDQLLEFAANLPAGRSTGDNEIAFLSRDAVLPPGHVIELAWQGQFVSWATYARWTALAALLGLVLLTWLLLRRQRGANPAPACNQDRPSQRATRAA